MPKGIAYSLKDYCERVDTTGKVIRADKRGYIEDKNPILDRLSLDSEQWLTLTTEFEQLFTTALVSKHLMRPKVKNITRCSDIVTSMLNTCTAMFKPYFKKQTAKNASKQSNSEE
ncbi:MAG: hypothetical protein ACI9LX_002390 [Paraglaciecola sp.]|jgi:hypothetical protein